MADDPVFQSPFGDSGAAAVAQPVQIDLTYDVVNDIPLPESFDQIRMEGGPYLGWAQVSRVKHTTGWGTNEIQGVPDSPDVIGDFVQLTCGRVERTVVGVAMRARDEPKLPAPDANTETMKLVDSEAVYFSPSVMPAGQRVYGVVWRYRYEYAVSPASDDTVQWGVSPFDNTGQTSPSDPFAFLKWLVGG